MCAARGNSEVSTVNSVLYLRSCSLMGRLTAVAGLLWTGVDSWSTTAGSEDQTVRLVTE